MTQQKFTIRPHRISHIVANRRAGNLLAITKVLHRNREREPNGIALKKKQFETKKQKIFDFNLQRDLSRFLCAKLLLKNIFSRCIFWSLDPIMLL